MVDDADGHFRYLHTELGGKANGDRVTEIRLTGLMKGYASGVQDTTYNIEALKKKPIKDAPQDEESEDNTVPFDIDDEDDI